ncbi:NADP-dependent oxidoreductase [Catenulispora sp. NF23]|uniref:NADP-dependent oxidoreductase n=1 Tax=Catenulispora pinistramenti TaxID=2705254 RepID=A0ABS5KNL4_9ACTN|nr:NADP-dependent oxidoreductase [Catenulispora pinistramenti]MBS2532624.1 NADP-dependent oxidoreductase [Catenulispora pinistramenti]MBS2547619.1 NADP-dependent oxidoreductase [Catenulispora pinistramenti]
MSVTTREWHFMHRPVGLPAPETFELVERDLPALRPGQCLVKNLVLSVDPYMRPRMDDVPSYVPPFELGEALTGGAVGEVIETRSDDVPLGSWLVHQAGWREHAVVDAKAARIVDKGRYPSSYYLGVLGGPGFAAFVGLFHVAGFRPGESVFVSGAAGAVGSMVGQFASLAGAERVVGSAGSAEKVQHLVDQLGYDAAFNYKTGPVLTQLQGAFPQGLDVYFDNVGADHLAAAIEVLNDYGRVAMCGTISAYNAVEHRAVPVDAIKVVAKRLRLQGFIAFDHEDLRTDFDAQVGAWLDSGRLKNPETITQGIESVPAAFTGMLTGANTGKAIIRLAEDQA